MSQDPDASRSTVPRINCRPMTLQLKLVTRASLETNEIANALPALNERN